MAIEYMGLNNIQGPLAVIEGVDDTFYEEMVTVTLDNGEKRIGRVTVSYTHLTLPTNA